MADRTHSHDTATPALSAETVSSEKALTFTYTNWRGETGERCVAPDGIRFRFGRSAWHADPQWLMSAYDFDKAAHREFAVKDIVFAAPTLSASHLAKEGGEAGTVERLKDAIEGECEGLAITDEQAAAILAHVGLPQPSPALAKGGDAVREVLEPFVYLREHDMRELAMPASRWRDGVRIYRVPEIDGEKLHPLYGESALRAALSTPTEGPASQTEGMGGDAGAIRSAAFRLRPDEQHGLATALAANLGYDLTPEPPHPDAPGPGRFEAAAEKAFAASGEDTAVVVPEALAALTPPETVEAVPGASDPAPATDDRERLVDRAYDRCARIAEREGAKTIAEMIREEKSWDGLDCPCGGGWRSGHAHGCPEGLATEASK